MLDLVELREELGLKVGPEEALLEALEAAAVAFVEREAQWFFAAVSDVTEVVVGDGTDRLRLRGMLDPAAPPASVSESAYVGATPNTITAVNADGYELRASGTPTNRIHLVRKQGYTWLEGYEYTAIASRGYSAGNEPIEIRELVHDLVLLKWNERDAAGGTFRTESIGPYSFTVGDLSRLPDRGVMPAASILDHWRGFWVVA